MRNLKIIKLSTFSCNGVDHPVKYKLKNGSVKTDTRYSKYVT